MTTTDGILLKNSYKNLREYLDAGGFSALRKAREMGCAAVIEEVTKSGLRGRGGAGFPTGGKWKSMLSFHSPKLYLCNNAAEGEPGTFKDRTLIRKNPYLVLEGTEIGAWAIGAARAFIGIKEIFTYERERLSDALAECREAGLVSDPPIEIVVGPDSYLFGEETALMRVVEGGPSMPRMKPSFLPGLGNGLKIDPEDFLYTDGVPAVCNNTETLCNLPFILLNGPEAFKKVGPAGSPGTMIFTLSGDVKRPGVYELPMGTPLSTLLYEYGGGPTTGEFKMVLPGGPSNRAVTPQQFDIRLDFDSLKKGNTGLGSGCVIVYDETACMVKAALTFASFFARESCGQCMICQVGSSKVREILRKVEMGRATWDDLNDLDVGWLRRMQEKEAGRCYLVNAVPIVVYSIIDQFPDEFARHINERRCPYPRDPLPSFRLMDYDEERHQFVMKPTP